MLKIDDKTTMSVGGLGKLHYAYGLSDAFNLMVEGYGIVAIGEAKGMSIPPTRPASARPPRRGRRLRARRGRCRTSARSPPATR
ncbi:MAG: hypothetical protein U0235_12130 [Polyangiaceae bacterium]